MYRVFQFVCCCAALMAAASSLRGAEPAPPNFPTATLGGTQFWSDELVFRDWRIQRNVLTDHCRLLDDRDFRMAWGTLDECRSQLEKLKRTRNLPPMSGRAVVTIHGLGRSRDCMNDMGQHLAEHTDWTWINVSYASSRRSLDEHAQSLARVLENLDGVDEIDLVCHSLGNLVVRRYLGEASLPAPRWQTDRRIKRMVMLGPPNNGAQLARLFKDNQLYGLVTGPSGKELAITWDEAQKRLATPTFPFAIIAGGRGNASGMNPVVDGDDDFVVGVEETRLAGAADFLVVPRLHGHLLEDEQVCQCALQFLRDGYLVAADKRKPIPLLKAPTIGRGDSAPQATPAEQTATRGERGASAP